MRRFSKYVLFLALLWANTISAQVGRGDLSHAGLIDLFYKRLSREFGRIDAMRARGGYDSLDQENEKVVTILEQFKDDLFSFPDSLNYDLIYLVHSADRQLVLVSWDKRTGGTMIDFTTMAFYKTPKGVRAKMLLDTSDKVNPYTYMHYNDISTVRAADGSDIYLAWGNGQASTAIPWQKLTAFTLRKGRLLQPQIFPGKASELFVAFDLHDFKPSERVPLIKVEDQGQSILVPLAGKKQGFSGRYDRYRFNGREFRKD